MDNIIQAGVNNPVFANQYFDGTYDPTQGSVYRTGDVLSNLLDDYTGEEVQFVKVEDTSGVTVDGILYRQKGEETFVDAEFLATGYINVARFGIKGDGVTDNTEAYARMIAILPEGSIVKFARERVYVGYLVSRKSISLDLNNSTFKAAITTTPVMRLGRGSTEIGTLTSPTNYGDRFFVTNETSLLQVGDLVVIKDESVRFLDDLPDINQEVLKVKSITGTAVAVEDMVRSTQSVGTIKLYKIDKTGGFFVKNGTIADSTAGLYIDGCENVTIESIRTKGINTANVFVTLCYDFKAYNCRTELPTATGEGGQGYGLRFGNSRNITVRDVYGNGMRHVVDFASCYNCTVDTVTTDNDISIPVVLAHNTYGGNLNVRNVRGSEFGYVVGWGSQGVKDPESFIARDITIRDVTQVRTLGSTSNSNATVIIPTSYSNLTIENISFFNKTPFYENNIAHTVVWLGGNPIDVCYVNNIKSNLIGCIVSVMMTTNTAPVVDTSLLVIDNVSSQSSSSLVRLRGGNNIQIGNLSQRVSTGTSAVLVEDLNGVQTIKTIDFKGVFKLPTDKLIMNLPTSFTTPLLGNAPSSTLLNGFSTSPSSGGNLPLLSFQFKTVLSLLRANANDLTLGTSSAFPKPTHVGQEITVSINEGRPKNASNADILIPASNLWVAPTTRDIRLCSGKNYIFRANNQSQWIISETPDIRSNLNGVGVSTREISDGDDLNLYRAAGVFNRAAGSSITVSNSPVNTSGVLTVYNSPVNGFLSQMYHSTELNRFFTRVFTTTWGGWVRLIHDGDLATTALAGIVKQGNFVTDITVPNATDLPTAITLANANKDKINQLLAVLRTTGIIIP